MSAISKSFTALNQVSAGLMVRHNEAFSYSVSGTFVGTVIFEQSVGTEAWIPLTPSVSATAAATGNIVMKLADQGSVLVRLRCSAFTSGTIVTTITDSVKSKTLVRNFAAAGQAKVGGTAGFVVAVADNIALVTCPASQTASKLVLPIPQMKVGDKITGFYLVGQIESGGGIATVDADLRVMTAAAADVTDASVSSITQLSVTADTIMSASNTLKEGFEQVVAVDESYYVVITVTTAAATDIALQGVSLRIIEGPVA